MFGYYRFFYLYEKVLHILINNNVSFNSHFPGGANFNPCIFSLSRSACLFSSFPQKLNFTAIVKALFAPWGTTLKRKKNSNGIILHVCFSLCRKSSGKHILGLCLLFKGALAKLSKQLKQHINTFFKGFTQL